MAEQDSHPSFWDKYVRVTLNSVMRNSRLTPKILFILAVAPFVVVVFMWALTLLE